jgi:protein-S-isoprenylcysteine O-methyltransferase Ste14
VSSFYPYVIVTMWATWLLYWWVCAANVKRTVQREPLGQRALHVLPMAIAFGLLAIPPGARHGLLFTRFVQRSPWLDVTATLMVLLGLGFAVWARVHLGSNWSGRVAVKEDHQLIRSGPYRLVRHPIYTGLLLAMLGTALALAEWRGLLATALMSVSYWRKLRIEEAVMRQTFGDAYRQYCDHTRALIPYVI